MKTVRNTGTNFNDIDNNRTDNDIDSDKTDRYLIILRKIRWTGICIVSLMNS